MLYECNVILIQTTSIITSKSDVTPKPWATEMDKNNQESYTTLGKNHVADEHGPGRVTACLNKTSRASMEYTPQVLPSSRRHEEQYRFLSTK